MLIQTLDLKGVSFWDFYQVEKKSDFYKSNIGTTNNVLFESENKNGYIEGFSENYIRFRSIWDPKLAGTIKQMKFNEIDPEGFAI